MPSSLPRHAHTRTLFLVALVAVLVLAQATSPPSPLCVFQAYSVVPFEDALRCIEAVPLQAAAKSQTLDALERAVQLYSFLDISRKSPEPLLPVQVDLEAGLASIRSRSHANDYAFHADVRDLFLSLQDAHTEYLPPVCYTSFTVSQPLALVAASSASGQQRIVVAPFFSNNIAAFYPGVDFRSLIGAEVLSINDRPALELLLKYANTSVGMSKDLGTRLNYALARPNPRFDALQVAFGYWQVRRSRDPLPDPTPVSYSLRLRDGSALNLTLPWCAVCLRTYTGLSSFMNDLYYRSSSSSSLLAAREPTNSAFARRFDAAQPPPGLAPISMLDAEPRSQKQREDHRQLPPDPRQEFQLLVQSAELTFWMLNDNQTLVMVLGTFSVRNLTDTYVALNKGFELAASLGLSRLIIDLSNNGGGSICLSRSLIAYLQQSFGGGRNYGPEDLPTSPLQVNLTLSAVELNVTSTVFSPGYYANFTNQPIAQNDTSYLIPGVPHVRGGVQRNYTRLVHINECGDFGYTIKPAKNFTASEILILTNGCCGSACAIFANHLANYDNVRTVVLGGINGQPQQYSSFPGGQVLASSLLYSNLQQLGQDIAPGPASPHELAPRMLPTTASYSINVREIYPPNRTYDALPSEFSFAKPTYHLPYSTVTAIMPQFAWYQLLPFFHN